MKDFERTHHTERLVVRPFNLSDAQALFDILKEEEVNVLIPLKIMEDVDEATEMISKHHQQNMNGEGEYLFAVCLREDNIPIGYIGVSQNEPFDFGYALKSDYWNKGITSEACKSVLNQLKEDDYKYITGTHDINNPLPVAKF